MTIVYEKFGIQVHHGDCLKVMRTLPGESVSSVITDPPSAIGFMGREWDKNRGGRTQWVAWLTERMEEAHRVLKPGGHALVWALPRTSHWTAWALEDAGVEIRDCVVHLYGSGFPKSRNIAKDVPGTDTARQWEGWGTALKPSSEHWWLCRKPLTGTVAATVLQHGTGALNVDACRVGNDTSRGDHYKGKKPGGSKGNGWGLQHDEPWEVPAGRWPPNTVLSHAALLDPATGEVIGDACADGCVEGCQVAELDRQSGDLHSAGHYNRGSRGPAGLRNGGACIPIDGLTSATYDDNGSASRFFPCFKWEAKAPSLERPMVNGKAWPTVKPVDLMRWMVRLITPPNGVILDCFAGTGTTGQAARAEGFPAILIEQDPDAIELIRARLDAKPKTEAATTARPVEEAPQDLFDLLGDVS